MEPLAVSPRAGVGSPSPFPATPVEWAGRIIAREPRSGYVGPMGAWDGDEVEGPEETRAASMAWGIPGEHGSDDEGRHPVLSSVLSGEQVVVRPRCDDCGSVMLRDDHGARWCASCVTAEVYEQAEPERTFASAPTGAELAALPVTLSPAVLAAHEALVRKTHPEELGEFTIELGFNPSTGAFDAMMEGRVMQALREMGPGVRIKGMF